MSHVPIDQRDWMMPSEAAAVLNIAAKTLSTWARNGRVSCSRTIGGHRRYAKVEIHRVLTLMELERSNGQPSG
jgi:predicted site-specific integrase-resolvase